MSTTYVPAFLDVPTTVMIWTVDECVALFVPVGLGFVGFNAPLPGLALGLVALWALKRLKGEQGGHYLYQWLYALCPSVLRLTFLPTHRQAVWLG